MGKKEAPKLGAKEPLHLAKYKSTKSELVVQNSRIPGTRSQFESKKLAKESERILRMKGKPLSRKLTDQDLPRFLIGSKEGRTGETIIAVRE